MKAFSISNLCWFQNNKSRNKEARENSNAGKLHSALSSYSMGSLHHLEALDSLPYSKSSTDYSPLI